MPETLAPPRSQELALSVADRLVHLPRFYAYKDVLTIGFAEDRDAFLTAWIDGTLPPAVRAVCEETLPPRTLECALLVRLCRQQQQILAAHAELLAEIRRAPEVEQV